MSTLYTLFGILYDPHIIRTESVHCFLWLMNSATKELLTGKPRFRQRLLQGGCILQDDAELSLPMCLSLVVLAYGAPSAQRLADFREAVASDNSKVVEEVLLQPQDPDLILPGGKTGLCLAAEHGSMRSGKLLLEAKADVNRADEALSQCTPLHWASARGQVAVARWLLASTADASKASADSVTPLHAACIHGHLEIARCLVAAGAEKDAAAQAGQTPLFAASSSGNHELVRWLVESRADATKAAVDGMTPLHLACISGHTGTARILATADGALANIGATDGVTPLHIASAQGHAEIVQALVESRADLDAWAFIQHVFGVGMSS